MMRRRGGRPRRRGSYGIDGGFAGRLRIVDDGADRYAAVLRDAGCADVTVRQLDWRTWYGLPGHHMTLVAAARPPG